MIQSRGLRNKNPGNIRKSDTPWRGEVPGDDPDFATFGTMVDGIRAMALLLRNYQRIHHLHTVESLVNRWAPPNENQTSQYVADVAARVGVKPDDPLNLEDPFVLSKLVFAVVCHENGPARAAEAISASDLHDGVVAALA